ncbi:MAG: acyl-CoA dehydratase activase-related protein [bacterium]|jgi:predicted nucleotide-binding protein (sugar kinase/HSP70/actin superfamily)
MAIRVGIPRAMLYYNFYPLWKTFLSELGVEVVLSEKTNGRTLDGGVRVTVDEACLPVKLLHGHVLELRDTVDVVFLPRLVSIERRAFICPKLMGLPDMVRQSVDSLPPLIDTCINLHKSERNFGRAFGEIGSYFSRRRGRIVRALRTAQQEQKKYESLVRSGMLPPAALTVWEKGTGAQERQPPSALRIGVLGHPYIIYDDYINQRLFDKLRAADASVVTADMLPDTAVRAGTQKLTKELFWTLGKRNLGAAYYFLDNGGVDGIIHLAAFGCGPDSLVGELVELRARKQTDVPFMLLNIDEHTGEAGLDTRLEAFLDMIRLRRDAVESDFSPHGNAAYYPESSAGKDGRQCDRAAAHQ